MTDTKVSMTDTKVRIIITMLWTTAHFAFIVVIFILFAAGGFKFEEMTTAIGLVLPMFSSLTALIYKRVSTDMYKTSMKGRKVSYQYSFLAIGTPLIFILLIFLISFLKALNFGFKEFEQYKIFLAIIETALAAYVGMMLRPLFEIPLKNQETQDGTNEGHQAPSV